MAKDPDRKAEDDLIRQLRELQPEDLDVQPPEIENLRRPEKSQDMSPEDFAEALTRQTREQQDAGQEGDAVDFQVRGGRILGGHTVPQGPQEFQPPGTQDAEFESQSFQRQLIRIADDIRQSVRNIEDVITGT